MIKLSKLFALSITALILIGCNAHLEDQINDLEQELAITESELANTEAQLEEAEDEIKTAEEVCEELAEKNTKK